MRMAMPEVGSPLLASAAPLAVLAVGVTAIAILGIWVMAVYNGLVSRRVRVQNSFAQIDVQLRRRHDLVPNLVASVKGAMAHERETLEAVTAARAAAVGAQQRLGGAPGDAARNCSTSTIARKTWTPAPRAVGGWCITSHRRRP